MCEFSTFFFSVIETTLKKAFYSHTNDIKDREKGNTVHVIFVNLQESMGFYIYLNIYNSTALDKFITEDPWKGLFIR